jgi:ParB/Sulfiredoxin domain
MDTLNTPPTGSEETETPEADAFEASRLLAELKVKAAEGSPIERHPQLALDRIKRAPELFQPRGHAEDERHVQELARAIKSSRLLDPMLVMQIGQDAYLIDGHHRLLAYELAGVRSLVPVEYFQGTIEEAVLAGGRANPIYA